MGEWDRLPVAAHPPDCARGASVTRQDGPTAIRNNYRNASSLPPNEIVLAARVRLLAIAADLDKVCLAASHVLDLPCFDTVLRFGLISLR